MKVLVTSSRMPFALGMVRMLAAEGCEVYAGDDHMLSAGNHSKYLAGHFVYPPARSDTVGFLAELERIVGEYEIDVIIPTFEEVFYISTQIERLSRVTKIFASPFATLARLHHKGAFARLVKHLGLPIAETVLVASDGELREAIDHLERYFARAAFSRGGAGCLTNTGPLAGALEISEVQPTPASPWLVQPFVDGETVCTYSTAHQGRVSAHLMYRIPRQRKHSTGIQFEAVDATESLKLIEPIVAELDYTGQISFDFLMTDDGLTFVECNPRATDGLLLMPREELAAGLLAPRPETFVLQPGGRVQLAFAVLADGFADRLDRLPETIGDLAQVRDAGSGWHDPLPTLYSTLAICHSVGQSFREHMGKVVAIAGDMAWDGEYIDGMSQDDAMLLTRLGLQRGES
ncbi:carbamoyl-phosphate synthase large subunit [Candidatus Mycobacterium methanotrophicum]|uniref:Carbamoyl-phosphate synthase large subunit n=1 Tax=Candidatus Mycobacterium methanotrophicum TaxID=2943498 RepID=A0ABY4QRR3_9MYCO|nr:carbamoyl-phosphate synthase large subunit [Candidatus Mycobacterium methanotrophicum]UQX12591.1 carbamoyl-phosphate synthase large subunit [Candidatus Mycobacterium methanotrophicum]